MGTVDVAKMSVSYCYNYYVLNQLDTAQPTGYKLFRDPQALGSAPATLGSLQLRAFESLSNLYPSVSLSNFNYPVDSVQTINFQN